MTTVLRPMYTYSGLRSTGYLMPCDLYSPRILLANISHSLQTTENTGPSPPPPPPPKPPLDPLPLPPAPSPPHPKPIHRHPQRHEAQHPDRLHRLRDDRPCQQEQAHAAEDDGRRDPGLVRALEVGLAHAQDDEAQHGEEVEGVARDAVEGDEGGELADEDVAGRQRGVEHHRVDGREADGAVLVADDCPDAGPHALALLVPAA